MLWEPRKNHLLRQAHRCRTPGSRRRGQAVVRYTGLGGRAASVLRGPDPGEPPPLPRVPSSALLTRGDQSPPPTFFPPSTPAPPHAPKVRSPPPHIPPANPGGPVPPPPHQGDSYSTPSSPEGPIPSSPAQPGLCNTHPAPPPRWRLPHRPPHATGPATSRPPPA